MRKENRAEIIQDALNSLDDELILETDEIREKSVNAMVERGSRMKNRKTWRYMTTIAASVAVFFIVSTVWNELVVPNQPDQMESIIEESVDDVTNHTDRSQNTDSVTDKKKQGIDELSATPDISEVAQSESQMQYSQEQIHLPNQEVGSVAGIESLTGVEIPAMKVELAQQKDVEMDMLAFFIYEGRCYVQDEYFAEGLTLVGDYVGTSAGLIDEWTTEDGYVDFAGSISGKFYEVKGYDPEFMLCMKLSNGAVETFIHNNGITLGKGSDLIEERLHLHGNVEKVTFKTQEEWDNSLQNEKNHVLSEEYDALVERFLDSFSSDDFMYISDIPLDEKGNGRYHRDEDNYHLTFHSKDGLRFDFTLYEDGYVRFDGFGGVCVQIDSSLYEEMVEVLKAE